MAQNESSERVRNILAIGPTGAGKSYFLNGLIGSRAYGDIFSLDAAAPPPGFLDADGPKPHVVRDCNLDSQDEGRSDNSYVVNYYDTPGVGDTANRTLEYLGITTGLVRKVPFHQIFFVYNSQARLTEFEKKHFFLLKTCLNRLNACSCTLVLNKVPNDHINDTEKLTKYRDQINSLFSSDGFEFENVLIVKYEESKDRHYKTINLLRPAESNGRTEIIQFPYFDFLYASNTPFDGSFVRTWPELKSIFMNKEQMKITDQEIQAKKESTKAKISQVQSEIIQLEASIESFEKIMETIYGIDLKDKIGLIGTAALMNTDQLKRVFAALKAAPKSATAIGFICIGVVAVGVGAGGTWTYYYYNYTRNKKKLEKLKKLEAELTEKLSNEEALHQEIRQTREMVNDLANTEHSASQT